MAGPGSVGALVSQASLSWAREVMSSLVKPCPGGTEPCPRTGTAGCRSLGSTARRRPAVRARPAGRTPLCRFHRASARRCTDARTRRCGAAAGAATPPYSRWARASSTRVRVRPCWPSASRYRRSAGFTVAQQRPGTGPRRPVPSAARLGSFGQPVQGIACQLGAPGAGGGLDQLGQRPCGGKWLVVLAGPLARDPRVGVAARAVVQNSRRPLGPVTAPP
jgi:hypothetical protein